MTYGLRDLGTKGLGTYTFRHLEIKLLQDLEPVINFVRLF